MTEIADIFRLHGPAYRAQFTDRMPPSHLRAMHDIESCRTACLGGQLYRCETCQDFHYSYHSCKNRHCPKCQNQQADQWLQTQQENLLPVPHFMVTFTIPRELRSVARSHQQIIYDILFRSSAEALQKLATDPRFIGGRIGMVGILHTWTRDLRYHPHVHYIATGGGLSADGNWIASRHRFLLPVKALSVIFRGKFRDLLTKTDLFALVDRRTWKKKWRVHCKPIGTGQEAFRYLAPYIFRVAISNNRILKLADGMVTFQYKESATDQITSSTLSAEEFMRRFLPHVLPPRFVKVRYYGLLSPTNRHLLKATRKLLAAGRTTEAKATPTPTDQKPPDPPRCPKCGSILLLVQNLRPQGRSPP